MIHIDTAGGGGGTGGTAQLVAAVGTVGVTVTNPGVDDAHAGATVEAVGGAGGGARGCGVGGGATCRGQEHMTRSRQTRRGALVRRGARGGAHLCTGSRPTSPCSRSRRRTSTTSGCSGRFYTRTGSSGSSPERRWERLKQTRERQKPAAPGRRRQRLRTAVGLVGVIAAVVHAVALPLQAHAHAIGALEGVGVAHFPELRRHGCAATHVSVSATVLAAESRDGRSPQPAYSESSSDPSLQCLMPSHTRDWNRHWARFLHTNSM